MLNATGLDYTYTQLKLVLVQTITLKINKLDAAKFTALTKTTNVKIRHRLQMQLSSTKIYILATT